MKRTRTRNAGWFKKGHDPRRHQLTPAERKRGGVNYMRKYTIVGDWPLDWLDAIEEGRVLTLLDVLGPYKGE